MGDESRGTARVVMLASGDRLFHGRSNETCRLKPTLQDARFEVVLTLYTTMSKNPRVLIKKNICLLLIVILLFAWYLYTLNLPSYKLQNVLFFS